jgi:hypothetical protein
LKVIMSPRSDITRAVVIAVASTIAACALCVFGYTSLLGDTRSDKCVDADSPSSLLSAGRTARNESVTVALAAIAAASSRSEPRGTPPEPSQAPAEEPEAPAIVSKEAILAKDKADAASLEKQFRAEEVDPFWAPKMERAVTEGVARLGVNLKVAEVSCRETICRARVAHADSRTREQDVDGILTMVANAGQAFAYSPPGEDATTVLYFSRKGSTLAPFQPPMRPLPPGRVPEELLSPDPGPAVPAPATTEQN